MFRSRTVAKVKHSNSCKTVLIFWFGNRFLTCHLFTSLKSLIQHTALCFFGVVKEGGTHSDSGWNSNDPSSQSLFNSLIIVSLCTLDIGNGLPCYCLASSYSSKEMGMVFQSPSAPSKSSSYSVSNSSTLCWSWWLKWVNWLEVCLLIFGV